MAKYVKATDGFTLSDLMLQDGFVFEIGKDCENEEEDQFSFSPDVPLTNEEALNLLNMDGFQEEHDNNNDNHKNSPITVCGIGFETLRAKMNAISGDGKVMKLIKQEGVGEVIPHDAQVTIKYLGHLEHTDEPFDSSFTRGGSETFRLNQGSLIPGLEIGITTMKKQEVALFLIHPDLAYGRYGCAPRIPPNEEILFIVHLIDYVDNGCIDALETLTLEERKQFPNVVKRAQAKFNTAKECFKKQRIKQAIREYTKGLEWLEEVALRNQEDEDEANKLLSRGYNNLAVCYNIENMPRRACTACNRVPLPTAKTYFNHGRALFRMGEYARSMEKLQMALKLEPKNEETIKEIRMVNAKHRAYLEVEKRLWSNCFKIKENDRNESSFQNAARDMCEAFAQDKHILRQPLPECLTPEEDKCIRTQAAAVGLVVTTHQRYGREVTYLTKPSF